MDRTSRAVALACLWLLVGCEPSPADVETPTRAGAGRLIFVEAPKIVCGQVAPGVTEGATWAGRADQGEFTAAIEMAFKNGGDVLVLKASPRIDATITPTAQIETCVPKGTMHGLASLLFKGPNGTQATVDVDVTADVEQWSERAAAALWNNAQTSDSLAAFFRARLRDGKPAPKAAPSITASAATAVPSASVATEPAPAEDPKRAKARTLGGRGIELCEKGDFAAALPVLEEAYRLVPAPTIRLWRARAMAGMGKLVEARVELQTVSGLKIDVEAPDAFRQAQQDAQADLVKLDERIPTLMLEVENADPAKLEVTIDGRRVTPDEIAGAGIGVGVPVNPGTRKLDVRVGDQRISREIKIAEGSKSEKVVLRFRKKK
jgi:hypothetical protein